MKEKFKFVCQSCGAQFGKWSGKCTQCNEWNSLVEERTSTNSTKAKGLSFPDQKPQRIEDITLEKLDRIPCSLQELDRVLGGGLVPGSVVLVGGEPGIGKSTLLLQASAQYAKSGLKVLYVSGEESPSQIALRAERLGVKEEALYVVSEVQLEKIKDAIANLKPSLLILDSIQTVQSAELDSQPGSVGQLRECTYEIINLAKGTGMPTFLVGHVTKEGAIAGPKVLEHMVDVVLQFEGTSTHSFRLLRAIKNRFGSTHELGVFEMSSEGMKDVLNPSELFLSESLESLPGSVIVSTMEGSRPILVEIQSLVSKTPLAMPRRTAIGMDPNRIALLVAILEKRAGLRLFDQDVYVNVAGGLRLNEPACDLGVIAAMISSFSTKPLPSHSIFFGEVGLGGEVRSVPRADSRIKEAKRIGLKRAYVPKRTATEIGKTSELELISIEHVGQLSDFI